MLKTLKESVEKLPRSGFVHLLYICNKDNGLTLKILKAYLTAGNRFKSARILCLNHTSKLSYKLRTKFKPPGKLRFIANNGRADCVLLGQICNKIN
jgi:hypothetical protein